MKIAVLGDLHYGVRNDNVAFLDNNEKFFKEIFFPYIKTNSIETIVQLGDLVDRRKYINYNTLSRLRKDFLEPLKELNVSAHFIVGNHDCTYKNTNDVNVLKEVLEPSYPFKIYYKQPEEISFDGCSILFIPWICEDNRQISLKSIANTKSTIAMGHLEIQGFEMYKGSIVSHGDDVKLFDRFDLVMSGHFHHRSTDGHIWYLGSHAEFTWSDYNDPRGFHIFDTDTREIKFIENPYKMFRKIWYDDLDEDFKNQKINYNEFQNSYVKIIVTNKTNTLWFEKFVENIENESPLDLQIIEDHLNLNLEDNEEIINEAESTISLCNIYINNTDLKESEKEKLRKTINQLYNEALETV